jgi:hypothetical protein
MTSAARGYNTHFLLKREVTFGTDPGGNYVKVPFWMAGLGLNRDHSPDEQAGTQRDPQTLFDGEDKVGGNVGLFMDLRNIGFGLTGLLGDPSNSGVSAPYTHTFTSGAAALPSYAMEVADKAPAAYKRMLGNMFNTMEITQEPKGGPAKVTFGIIGKSYARNSSSYGGTPTELVAQRVSNFLGTISMDGSALGSIRSCSLNYSNNLKPEWFVNSTGPLSEIDLDQVSISGKLSVRYKDVTLMDKAENGTRIKITNAWTIDADNKLTINTFAAKLKPVTPVIQGPAGYDVTYDWDAEYSSGDSKAFNAVLLNTLDGTAYA